jgi:hypothetical protein
MESASPVGEDSSFEHTRSEAFQSLPRLSLSEQPLDRERLQALYKEALEEHERFVNINQQLQKRLVQYFQEKKVKKLHVISR